MVDIVEFRVGDTVRIREWDDMAEQYGTDEDPLRINTPRLAFVDNMKSMCGMEFELQEDDFLDTWVLKKIVNEYGVYTITEYMLELVTCENEGELETSEELDSFLNRFKTLKVR